MTARPTFRGVILLGGCLVLGILLTVMSPAMAPIGLVLSAAVLMLMLLDLRNLPTRKMTEIDARFPDQLYLEREGALMLHLAVPARYAALDLDLRVDSDALLQPVDPVASRVATDEAVEIRLGLMPLRRGTTSIGGLWLRWRSPMGLVSRTDHRAEQARVPISPNIPSVKDAALAMASRTWQQGQRQQLQRGDGSEFDALRDYVPGMDPRSLDWKRSAHYRRLVCKEYRAERNHQLLFAIDTGQLMSEPLAGLSRLDHAINGCLQLAYTASRSGDKVGMMQFDRSVRQFLPPIAGQRGFDLFRHHCAACDYHSTETNYAIAALRLAGELKRRSLIILMTDFIDTVSAELMIDHVSHLTRQHLVLFVSQKPVDLEQLQRAEPDTMADLSRSVIARNFLADRQQVLKKLRRLGVDCLEVPPGAVGGPMIDQYLSIKQRDRL